MNKTTFYIITVRLDEHDVSYALRVPNYENLYAIIESIQRECEIITLNVCDTKAEAIDLANFWNKGLTAKGIRIPNAPTSHVIWK